MPLHSVPSLDHITQYHCLLNPAQVGCCPAPNPVLYYKVMTPQWLEDHASLSQLNAATAASLNFKMTKTNARVIKVPLFQRGELPTNDISVSITLHLEDPPTADSDFLLAICDGTQCNGIWIQDKGNYPAGACGYTSVKSGITYTNAHATPGNCGASITFEHYPNTAKLTFYPANKWGSFSIPPSGGYTTAKTFTDQMDVTNGLYVEAYGNNVNEQYKLMFMEVKVTKN